MTAPVSSDTNKAQAPKLSDSMLKLAKARSQFGKLNRERGEQIQNQFQPKPKQTIDQIMRDSQ